MFLAICSQAFRILAEYLSRGRLSPEAYCRGGACAKATGHRRRLHDKMMWLAGILTLLMSSPFLSSRQRALISPPGPMLAAVNFLLISLAPVAL